MKQPVALIHPEVIHDMFTDVSIRVPFFILHRKDFVSKKQNKKGEAFEIARMYMH